MSRYTTSLEKTDFYATGLDLNMTVILRVTAYF
jgi:hypothetical protein